MLRCTLNPLPNVYDHTYTYDLQTCHHLHTMHVIGVGHPSHPYLQGTLHLHVYLDL